MQAYFYFQKHQHNATMHFLETHARPMETLQNATSSFANCNAFCGVGDSCRPSRHKLQQLPRRKLHIYIPWPTFLFTRTKVE
jgi:hypothetical protein